MCGRDDRETFAITTTTRTNDETMSLQCVYCENVVNCFFLTSVLPFCSIKLCIKNHVNHEMTYA